MAKKREFTFNSRDGRTKIHAVEWSPEQGTIAGVLQIFHGMIEFIGRYEEFAEFLTERGFVVVGNDHLGHGASIVSKKDYGFFSEKNGNTAVLADVHHLKRITEKRYPDVPYYILGHSMGSFLLRQYLCLRGKELDGAVIMGTGTQPLPLLKLGKVLCRGMAAIFGWHYRSLFVDMLAFGGYNKHFRPARTGRDWLTKDEELVDRCLADDRCTFRFTINGYYNLFTSIEAASKDENLRKMPKDLPILFTAGGDDPVGNFGKGVEQVKCTFEAIGMQDVTKIIYKTDRHEILNETDRETVYEDICAWLEKCLAYPRRKSPAKKC